MSEPEPSKPKDLGMSPDATVRLVAGVPLDPRRTQQLDISNIISQHQDAGSTQRLTLPPTEAPVESTQKLLHPVLDEATVRMQKLDPPIEDAGSTQRLTLSAPEASPEDTQKIPRSVVDDATVRIQKMEPPAEDAGSTQRLVLPSAEVTAGGTQKFMRPGVEEATVSMQKVDPPIEDAGSTQRLTLPVPEASSESTQKIPRHTMDDPPLRVQKVDQPAEAAGQTQKLPLQPQAPKSSGWKLPLALGGAVVLAALAFVWFSRPPALQTAVVPPPVRPGVEPAGAQAYLDKAKAGDVYAMRMLGTMYYNGLNVPQDREKGLYWYRKAAEKSDAARAELSQIEGGR